MTERIEAVQRMQDFIQNHLDQKITLSDLARASHYSPWYSARLFKTLTGLAPAEYIRRLKLSKSALRLRDEGCKVVEVSNDLGFGSVDGYQRAFYREFGCNPGTYVLNPVPLSLFLPFGVKFKSHRKEERDMETTKNVFIQLLERQKRKVLIKPGFKATEYFSYCQEVGCEVWGILTSIRSVSGEPVGLWLPEAIRRPSTSVYVQGVEVETTYNGPLPEGFETIDLPRAWYLMFQGEPFEEDDYAEAIVALEKAMDRYDPKVIGFAWDDENPRIQLEPIGTRGYIEMRAVKPLKGTQGPMTYVNDKELRK